MGNETDKLDKTMSAEQDSGVTIEHGFPGERLYVLPRPRVEQALSEPGIAHLVVTDCGYFPQARAHGIERKSAVPQTIVIVCVRGRGWCRIGDAMHAVAAGQVLVVPPDTPHSYGAEHDDPWTVWWLHLAGPDVKEFLRIGHMTAEQPVRTPSDTFRLVALMEDVVNSISRDTSTSSLLAASGAAWHLMALLVSNRTAPGTRTDMINVAKEYLRNHIDSRVTVDELASMARMSSSHFAALFRRQVGMPVLQYQTQLRMARAREMLDKTDIAVAAVAQRVGYADPFYFSRQFKAIHHVTPLNYRNQAKG
jgi:AraC family transcriptional regulator of arabinose operon